MFKNLRGKKLKLEILERTPKQSQRNTELVQLSIHTNKPVPPATHGTVCLRGKQK
ncbi:hypothetical protein M3181_22150 [Mesobacillus maritimus]|uniref:hypothetical protein n=1 Tax=Mesobacillus maritimus TaxID=1643336 RepID=UPI00203CD2BA|nr:hypothetical protein [Mesobacillus maritimus]MCM3671662.1 hypothetical protein [Mesobacillus maritimus]